MKYPFARTRTAFVAVVAVVSGTVFPGIPRSSPLPARPPDDLAGVAERIPATIECGRGNFLELLGPLREEPRKDYPLGRLALVVAAALHAGAATDQPDVVAAIRVIAAGEPAKTYSAACMLFALDAYCARSAEELRGRLIASAAAADETSAKGQDDAAKVQDDVAKGSEETPSPPARQEVLDAMARVAAWLVGAQVERRGGWTYEPEPDTARCDFSNTQFAVLALAVAMDRGVTVEREVFERVAALFATSVQNEATSEEVVLVPSLSLAARLGIDAAPRPIAFRAVPGGWGYRPTGSGRGTGGRAREDPDPASHPALGPAPYCAMTAAGTSSLAVALEALARSGWSGGRAERQARAALLAGQAWIARHFELFLKDDRNLPYTLYSLEKAGDRLGIERFGAHDWYLRGAAALLARQKKNGSFGSYIDSSFALLFLTRASRSMAASASPEIRTGEPAGAAKSTPSGLVYLERAGGFVPAADILFWIGERRDGALARVLEEVFANASDALRDRLVPALASLAGGRDKIARTAATLLADWTTIEKGDAGDYDRWHRLAVEIEALGNEEAPNVERLAAILAEGSPTLGSRVLAVARRRQLRALAPALVDRLAGARGDLRRDIHGTLALWWNPPAEAPETESNGTWARLAAEWRRLLREKGG